MSERPTFTDAARESFSTARARLGGDLELTLGVWAALADRQRRGLGIPSGDWWPRAADALAERCGSALFIDAARPAPSALSAVSELLAAPARAAAADPGLLGDLYAAGLTGAARKAKGRFYTPGWLAERVLADLPDEGHLLDPSCGGGRFLLAAWARRGRDPEALRALHGVDVDPLAVALCRAAFAVAAEDAGPLPLHLDVGDPLLGRVVERLRGAALPRSARPWRAPIDYDLVVGNPPYRAGRHGGGLVAEAALYRRAFAVAEYQLDGFPLFIELAVELLRPGGRLALVVPNAWLSNLRTGKLRRFLLDRCAVERVHEVPAAAFDAGVETVVLVARRGGSTEGPIPVLDLDGRPGGELLVDPARPHAPLPLVRSPAAGELLRAARRWTCTLGDIAEVTRGVNPYHHTTHTAEQIAARVHHADRPRGEAWVPELRGRHLGPYRLWWSGAHWLEYGPWLKEPRHPRFFDGPRLVVRKVLGDTLCAAWLDAPFVCDQSVYVARIGAEQPWPPGALLAFANARLVAALLRARHQEDDRLFPQIKVAELRGLPLPPVEPEASLELAAWAMELQRLETGRLEALDASIEATDPAGRALERHRRLRAGWPHRGGRDADRAALAETVRLRDDIEARVARLYGVDPGAIAEWIEAGDRDAEGR